MSSDFLERRRGTSKTVLLYTVFCLVPILWLVVLSLQPNEVSRASANLWPSPLFSGNFLYMFSQPNWVWGYINLVAYVSLNIVISLLIAVPAAYAFSRYRFLGSENLFFFSLVFRLIPPAIIIIPLVQMFSALGLIDSYLAVALAHSLFTVPVSIWILEGFISSIPKEMEEIARVDGYSAIGGFFKVMLPQIRTGIGVAAFFCFMFSWVELLLANALTTVNAKPVGVVMRIVAEPLGQVHIGIASAASVLLLIPALILVWFLRKHLARGFSLGRIG